MKISGKVREYLLSLNHDRAYIKQRTYESFSLIRYVVRRVTATNFLEKK